MWRTAACVALAAIGSAMAPTTARGQAPPHPPVPGADASPLFTSNRTIQASLDRIAAGSALWREALEALRSSGRRALILTPDQVAVADRDDGKKTRAFDPTVLAEVVPVPAEHGHVRVVVAVVNLPLIEEVHTASWLVRRDLEADLDRILVHEIYGHAIPYLLAGHMSGRCADPTRGERASDACSIRRENAVRAQLGLGRRTDYGLGDLALARRGLF